jgi:hypothetical protein
VIRCCTRLGAVLCVQYASLWCTVLSCLAVMTMVKPRQGEATTCSMVRIELCTQSDQCSSSACFAQPLHFELVMMVLDDSTHMIRHGCHAMLYQPLPIQTVIAWPAGVPYVLVGSTVHTFQGLRHARSMHGCIAMS